MRRLLTVIAILIFGITTTKALEPVRVAIVYTAGASTEINVEVIDYSTTTTLHTRSMGTLTANSSGIISFILDGGTPVWSGIPASNVNANVIVNVKTGVGQMLYAQYRLDELMIVQAQTGTGSAQPAGAGAFKSAAGTITAVTSGDDLDMENNNISNVSEISGNSTTGVLTVNSRVSQEIGNFNTAFGIEAYNETSTGTVNVALGYYSLNANTSGSNNTAIGGVSMRKNTTGSNNTAVGLGSLQSNTEGSNNTAIGAEALSLNTTGNNNTAIGKESLWFNTTGYGNTAIGYYALKSNSEGFNNTAIGRNSMSSNTTGIENTANGYFALNANTSGNFNTAIGKTALISNISGSSNTAIGRNALYNNTTGGANTMLGSSAGYKIETGSQNVFLGLNAGQNASQKVDAEKSIAIGTFTYTMGDNSIAIGSNTFTTADNQAVIGNSSITETQLRGVRLMDHAGGGTQNIQVDDNGKIVVGDASYSTGTNIGDLASIITFSSGGNSITTSDLNGSHPIGTVLYLFETSGTGDIYDDDGTGISFTSFQNIIMVKDGTGNWRIMSFTQ